MVVGIDFHKFIRVARVGGLPLVPTNDRANGRRWQGFLTSFTIGLALGDDLQWFGLGEVCRGLRMYRGLLAQWRGGQSYDRHSIRARKGAPLRSSVHSPAWIDVESG